MENTFVYEDGRLVDEQVKLELTESLSYKDFVSSGLLTKSSKKILETGGMIKIEATTVSGKPVKIHSGKEMVRIGCSESKLMMPLQNLLFLQNSFIFLHNYFSFAKLILFLQN